MLDLRPCPFVTDAGGKPSFFGVLSSGVDASCPILSNPMDPVSLQFVYALTGNRNLKGKIEYFIAILVELRTPWYV